MSERGKNAACPFCGKPPKYEMRPNTPEGFERFNWRLMYECDSVPRHSWVVEWAPGCRPSPMESEPGDA